VLTMAISAAMAARARFISSFLETNLAGAGMAPVRGC
jgi:hypothetical protein